MEDTAKNKIVKKNKKNLCCQEILGETNNMCHINDKCYEEEQKQLVDRRDGVILYRMSRLASLIC